LVRGEKIVHNKDLTAVAEKEYSYDEQLFEKIAKARGVTVNQLLDLCVVKQPSVIQNLIFCYELRKRFGADAVASTPGFNQAGIFMLRRGPHVLYPQRDDQKRIVELRFYKVSEVLKVK